MNERDYRRGTVARIRGPGTTTSDSIPAKLSKGEFVIKASSAAKIGDKALNFMNKTGRVPMKSGGMMVKGRRPMPPMKPKARVKMQWGGMLGKVALGTGLLGAGYKAYTGVKGMMDERRKRMEEIRRQMNPQPAVAPVEPPAAPAPAPAAPLNQGATDALEERMRKAGMAKGGKVKSRMTGGRTVQSGTGSVMRVRPGKGVVSSVGRGPEDPNKNGFTDFGYRRGGGVGLRKAMMGGGKSHPGFKAVAAKIGRNPNIRNPGAVLAAATRRASPAAKKANPRLMRVPGA